MKTDGNSSYKRDSLACRKKICLFFIKEIERNR